MIKYISVNGTRLIESRQPNKLNPTNIIKFANIEKGILYVNNKQHTVTGGQASVPRADFRSDGESENLLILQITTEAGYTELFKLESLNLINGFLYPKGFDMETQFIELYKKHLELEALVKENQHNIAELKKICSGHDIFNFAYPERK